MSRCELPLRTAMNTVDSDQGVLEAHRLLVKRGVIEPLASTDDGLDYAIE